MLNLIKWLLLNGGDKGPGPLVPSIETFDSPPTISEFTLTQLIKETFTNEAEETFDSPPSISSFTLTQITE